MGLLHKIEGLTRCERFFLGKCLFTSCVKKLYYNFQKKCSVFGTYRTFLGSKAKLVKQSKLVSQTFSLLHSSS